MKKTIAILLGMSCAGSALAASDGAKFEIQAFPTDRGVVLQSNNADIDLGLTLAAPDGSTVTSVYRGNEAIPLEAHTGDLPDGLYTYEIRPIVLTGPTSDATPYNLRGLGPEKSTGLSPTSGSFRVVNGQVTIPDLVEADHDLIDAEVHQ